MKCRRRLSHLVLRRSLRLGAKRENAEPLDAEPSRPYFFLLLTVRMRCKQMSNCRRCEPICRPNRKPIDSSLATSSFLPHRQKTKDTPLPQDKTPSSPLYFACSDQTQQGNGENRVGSLVEKSGGVLPDMHSRG